MPHDNTNHGPLPLRTTGTQNTRGLCRIITSRYNQWSLETTTPTRVPASSLPVSEPTWQAITPRTLQATIKALVGRKAM